jgi:flagellar biosynthetic protein FliQ
MNSASVLEIGMQAMVLATKLAAPILITALLVGVLVGLVQAATQVQEATVGFVPKFAAVGVSILLSGNWMLSTTIDFTKQLWASVPNYLS